MVIGSVAGNIIASVAGAIIPSVMTGLKKKEKGETFKAGKTVQTGIVASILGIVMYMSGQEVSSANIEAYMAANAGIVVALESGLMWAWRAIKNKNS